MFPWFVPGVVLAIVIGAVAARPVARVLSTRPAVAWLLITSLGIILAATLIPAGAALTDGATSSGTTRSKPHAPWPQLPAIRRAAAVLRSTAMRGASRGSRLRSWRSCRSGASSTAGLQGAVGIPAAPSLWSRSVVERYRPASSPGVAFSAARVSMGPFHPKRPHSGSGAPIQ